MTPPTDPTSVTANPGHEMTNRGGIEPLRFYGIATFFGRNM